jgi:hypothetical protein
VLRAVAAMIVAWAVGFAAWAAASGRALAAEGRRAAGDLAGELRERWSPPRQ